MSTTTFDAVKHPRKGSSTDTGNAGHFASRVLTDPGSEANLDVDLNFLVDETGDFGYDVDADLAVPEKVTSTDDFELDFADEDSGPQLGFGMVPKKLTDPDPYVGSLRESEVYAFASAKARILAADYNNAVESETLVSEAVISYMSAIRGVSITTGVAKPVSPITTDPAKARGFLFNAMKNIARREAFGTDGHDMKGHRELNKAIAAEAQSTGAQPSQARIDELAEQVRLSFEPRRRPKIGFHRKTRMVSMDAQTDSGAAPALVEAERAMSDAVTTSVAHDFETGSLGELVSAGLESPGAKAAATRAAAVRSIWEVVREGTGAPAVVSGTLTETQASTLRKDLASAGGVRAALRAWDAAEDDHPSIVAVFTPFGADTTDDDRCAIMDVLAQRPAYAPDLVDAAIATATTARKA